MDVDPKIIDERGRGTLSETLGMRFVETGRSASSRS